MPYDLNGHASSLCIDTRRCICLKMNIPIGTVFACISVVSVAMRVEVRSSVQYEVVAISEVPYRDVGTDYRGIAEFHWPDKLKTGGADAVPACVISSCCLEDLVAWSSMTHSIPLGSTHDASLC